MAFSVFQVSLQAICFLAPYHHVLWVGSFLLIRPPKPNTSRSCLGLVLHLFLWWMVVVGRACKRVKRPHRLPWHRSSLLISGNTRRDTQCVREGRNLKPDVLTRVFSKVYKYSKKKKPSEQDTQRL